MQDRLVNPATLKPTFWPESMILAKLPHHIVYLTRVIDRHPKFDATFRHQLGVYLNPIAPAFHQIDFGTLDFSPLEGVVIACHMMDRSFRAIHFFNARGIKTPEAGIPAAGGGRHAA